MLIIQKCFFEKQSSTVEKTKFAVLISFIKNIVGEKNYATKQISRLLGCQKLSLFFISNLFFSKMLTKLWFWLIKIPSFEHLLSENRYICEYWSTFYGQKSVKKKNIIIIIIVKLIHSLLRSESKIT